jgi:hypothetical protein
MGETSCFLRAQFFGGESSAQSHGHYWPDQLGDAAKGGSAACSRRDLKNFPDIAVH